jgi:hypothetical protein
MALYFITAIFFLKEYDSAQPAPGPGVTGSDNIFANEGASYHGPCQGRYEAKWNFCCFY